MYDEENMEFAEAIRYATQRKEQYSDVLNSMGQSNAWDAQMEKQLPSNPRPKGEEAVAEWATNILFNFYSGHCGVDSPEGMALMQHGVKPSIRIGTHANLTKGLSFTGVDDVPQFHNDHNDDDQECFGVVRSWDKLGESTYDGPSSWADPGQMLRLLERVCDGNKTAAQLSKKEVYNTSFKQFNSYLTVRGMGLDENWLSALEGVTVKCVSFEAWIDGIENRVAKVMLPIAMLYSKDEDVFVSEAIENLLVANENKAIDLDKAEQDGKFVNIGARGEDKFSFEEPLVVEGSFMYLSSILDEQDVYQYRHLLPNTDSIMCSAVTVTPKHIIMVEFGELPRVIKVQRRGTLGVCRKLGLKIDDLVEDASIILDEPVFLRGIAGSIFTLTDKEKKEDIKMRTIKTIQRMDKPLKNQSYTI